MRGVTGAAIAVVLFVLLGAGATSAQVPTLPGLPTPELPTPASPTPDRVESTCIDLDGRCLFEVAAPLAELSEREREIELRVREVSSYAIANPETEISFRQEETGGPIDLFAAIGDREWRVLSVTDTDAQSGTTSIAARADDIQSALREGLRAARAERRPETLRVQLERALVILGIMLFASALLSAPQRRSRRAKRTLKAASRTPGQPISRQLERRGQFNLIEALHRTLQALQIAIWFGGLWAICGLFPYTRPAQELVLNVMRIPVRLLLVVLVTYGLSRLSYAGIDRFTTAVSGDRLLAPEADLRMQLRVTTISRVAKSIATVMLVITGGLAGLWAVGINIAPLLAGAGIIGIALSLAAQNTIRDAINGFFILLEDQYAVGDAIAVGTHEGIVENMNLRVTQLRGWDGALITVPNSEVRVVSNHSSHWSRADLKIPIAYQADVKQALQLVGEVAYALSRDPLWSDAILEPPLILGVDEFEPLGMVVRVWIKTQPLRQWEVAREFRHRVKMAADASGIQLALAQQSVLYGPAQTVVPPPPAKPTKPAEVEPT